MAIVLCCLSELENKTLFLKAMHTSATGLEGMELGLAWNPPHWKLVLAVLEGARSNQ